MAAMLDKDTIETKNKLLHCRISILSIFGERQSQPAPLRLRITCRFTAHDLNPKSLTAH